MAQAQGNLPPKPITVAPIPPAPKCPVNNAFPVLLSSFILAANAGFVNAFFLESLFGTSVSHLTGSTTRAAAQFADGRYEMMFRNLGIVFFFFCGSFLNALLVGDSQMRMVQNYGFAIMLEAALLMLPVFIPTNSRFALNCSVYIVAMACGLQNAMLTIYGTAIVRTTHVTGLVTDVGILVGLYLRDLIFYKTVRKEGMWKLKIMIPLYLGFFTGGTVGMISLSHISGPYALIIPSTVTAWVGVGFVILRYIHNRSEARKALLEAERKRREQQEREEDQRELMYHDSQHTIEAFRSHSEEHHKGYLSDVHEEEEEEREREREREHEHEQEGEFGMEKDDIPLKPINGK